MHARKFESALKSRQFEKKFRREKHAGNVFLKRPRYNVWLRISWFIYFVRYAPSCSPLRIPRHTPWQYLFHDIIIIRGSETTGPYTQTRTCTARQVNTLPRSLILALRDIIYRTKFRNNKSEVRRIATRV